MNEIKLSISVGQLVEFVYQRGNLAVSFQSNTRKVNGIIGHQTVQKSRPDNYQSEITIKHQHYIDDLCIEINGRIDGVYNNNEEYILEEIKTISLFKNNKPEFETIFFHCFHDYQNAVPILEGKNPVHWAQALIYAYIFCKQKNLNKITIHLTYYINEKHLEHTFTADFSIVWLEDFFKDTIEKWLKWALKLKEWKELRDQTILDLNFPYTFRDEQRRMAVAVYKAIVNQKILYVRAPTGTGKTLASIFPAVKAMGEGKIDKIFYLTAKTVGRTVAFKTMKLLSENGLKFKSLILTAKDKVCYKDFPLCDPEYCVYAQDYYEKARVALLEAFTYDDWTSELIDKISRKYFVCPFEFSLDLALYADIVIGDYNYVFDPRVYLKRFFEEVHENYCFLVDEAHNLPDRSREMYSGDLTTELVELPFNHIKNKKSKLYQKLLMLKKILVDISNSYEQNEVVLDEFPKEINMQIRDILVGLELWIPKQKASHSKFIIMQYYFRLIFYLMIYDLVNSNHRTLLLKSNAQINLKIFCMNASEFLLSTFEKSISASIFSATLIPMDYFEEMISNNTKKNEPLLLNSPFEQKNFGLFVYSSVNTEYKHRESSYQEIADIIHETIELKQGNYLIYFPSYEYLRRVHELFIQKDTEAMILVQEKNMNEEQRDVFLSNFNTEKSSSLIAFVVLGGIFGEGIDLVGDNLIGAIIVGVGLPQLNIEKNLINSYYKLQSKDGYDYAYRFPGFNRVLQAAGRVIRTENDRGIVLLIDQRYLDMRYKKLFPQEWSHYKKSSTSSVIIRYIQEFWEK